MKNYIKSSKIYCITAAFFIAVLFLTSCAESIDYGKRENWAYLPDLDSKHVVDVFYAYPTIGTQRRKPYIEWKNPAIQQQIKNTAAQQCGPFAHVGRIFVPFYRQTELFRALKDVTRNKQEFSWRGVEDIKDAFRYYLKHYNNGRPFILVGHSQGSYVLLELIRDEMKDPKIYNRMVAAYLIGYPKMPKQFPDAPHIKLAEKEDDIGVVMTWNSQAPEVGNSLFTGPGTYCINPLNWSTKPDVMVDPSKSLGAVFFDGNNRIIHREKNFCAAVIHPQNGALIVFPINRFKYDPRVLGTGIYHSNDIYFFYYDIAKNVSVRVKAYFDQKKK